MLDGVSSNADKKVSSGRTAKRVSGSVFGTDGRGVDGLTLTRRSRHNRQPCRSLVCSLRRFCCLTRRPGPCCERTWSPASILEATLARRRIGVRNQVQLPLLSFTRSGATTVHVGRRWDGLDQVNDGEGRRPPPQRRRRVRQLVTPEYRGEAEDAPFGL